MPRPRSESRDKAFEIWIKSNGKKKLVDIASELGVPDKKVRKWKAADKWDERKKKAPKPKRKRGAPIGNKNSVGHKSSAPKRNANAVKTGEYETIWLDALDAREQEIYKAIDTNPLTVIDETIRLLTLRERRMLIYLRELQEEELSETRDIYKFQDKPMIADAYDEQTGEASEIVVTQEQKSLICKIDSKKPLIDRILAIEEALTRVQERKIRAIEIKNRLLAKWEKMAQAVEQSQRS